MTRCPRCLRGALMDEGDRIVCLCCGHVERDEPSALSFPSNGTGYSPLLAWRVGAATEHSGAQADDGAGYEYGAHGERHSLPLLGVADQ